MLKVQEFLTWESDFEPVKFYEDLEKQALLHVEVSRLLNMLLIAKDDSVTMTEVSVPQLTRTSAMAQPSISDCQQITTGFFE